MYVPRSPHRDQEIRKPAKYLLNYLFIYLLLAWRCAWNKNICWSIPVNCF